MTKMDKPSAFSRRSLLMGGGALVISVGMPVGVDMMLAMRTAYAQGAKPPLMPDQLSSYIAINADGTVSAFFGKMDMGHGLFVAIGQIVAEELDVPFKAVTVFMGDTATSVNQGGASGSTGIQFGGKQMRMAAAEARRVLVEMAALKLGTPADQRALFQRPARLEQAVGQSALCARQGPAQEGERVQDRRPADQTRGRGRKGVLHRGLLHRREGTRHGAWPRHPPGGRRRGAGEGRRELDQGHPWRQGRLAEGLSRPHRREGVGRDPRRR
jgi:CO/xanthine dehydrogenase Mo-binding subunit